MKSRGARVHDISDGLKTSIISVSLNCGAEVERERIPSFGLQAPGRRRITLVLRPPWRTEEYALLHSRCAKQRFSRVGLRCNAIGRIVDEAAYG